MGERSDTGVSVADLSGPDNRRRARRRGRVGAKNDVDLDKVCISKPDHPGLRTPYRCASQTSWSRASMRHGWSITVCVIGIPLSTPLCFCYCFAAQRPNCIWTLDFPSVIQEAQTHLEQNRSTVEQGETRRRKGRTQPYARPRYQVLSWTILLRGQRIYIFFQYHCISISI